MRDVDKIKAQLHLMNTILHTTPNPFVLKDKGSVYIAVNKAFCEFLGRKEEEIVGKTDFDLFPAEEADKYVIGDRAVMSGGQQQKEEWEVMGKAGLQWLNVVKTPVFEVNGECTGVLYSVTDISKIKMEEEALRESEEKYRILTENVTDIIFTMDMNLRFTYISPSVTRRSGYSIEEAMAQSLEESFTPASLENAMKLFTEVIALEKMEQEDLYRSRTLEVEQYCKDGSTVWSEVEMTFLRDPDGQAVGILGVSRDITERKRAEQALQESERLYRLLADNVTDVISIMDMNLQHIFVSPSITRLRGYSVEEAMAETVAEFLTPDSLKVAMEAFAEEMAIEEMEQKDLFRARTLELEMTCKDGSTVWTENTISPLRDQDGKLIGIVGVARDISEHKQAEEALRESERRFRELANLLPQTVFEIDNQGNFTFSNNRGLEQFGYTWEDIEKGINVLDVLIPDEHERMLRSIQEVLNGVREEGTGTEYIAMRKDGSTFPIIVYASAIRYKKEVTGMRGIAADITERKQAEEALRESEERYKALYERSLYGVYIHDFEGNFIDANESALKLLGYKREEMASLNFTSLLDEDGLSKAFKSLEEIRRTGFQKKPDEFKLRGKGGGYVWVETEASLIYQHGKPYAIQGIARDITEHKRAEEELQKLAYELGERLKELGCLYGIYKLVEKQDISLEQIFQDVVDLIPPAWQYPEITCARITMGDKEFKTDNFKTTEWMHTANIRIKGHKEGTVEVYYLQERPDIDEGPFSTEERALLEAIAEALREITERKRVEEALRKSEEQYRLLAENVNDVIWTMDMDLWFTYISPSTERMRGYSVGESMAQSMEEILTPESYRVAMQVYAEELATEEMEQKDLSRTRTLQLEQRCKDGTTIWVESTMSFLRNPDGQAVGIVGVSRDITERKRVEQALQESEEKYRDLFENANDLIQSVRPDGSFLYVNRAWQETLGYSEEEVASLSLFDIVHPDSLAHCQEVFQQVMSQQEVSKVEALFVAKDGREIAIEGSANCRIVNGKPAYTRGIFRDITERKKLDQLKDDFLSLVSHELRSPLTVIMGAVDTVLSEGSRLSPEETRQLLQDAAWEVDLLAHLLENLLELSRAQAQRLFLYAEPLRAEIVVEDAVEKIRRQYSAHRLVIDLPEGIPSIHADRLRLECILHNLLENAVKYSPKGSRIRVFAELESDRLVVGIADQGVGISLQDQAKLFKPFQQLEGPKFDGVKGAGLGLLVCKRLVEAHNGQIWLESEPGRGSTFFFALPLGDTAT